MTEAQGSVVAPETLGVAQSNIRNYQMAQVGKDGMKVLEGLGGLMQPSKTAAKRHGVPGSAYITSTHDTQQTE